MIIFTNHTNFSYILYLSYYSNRITGLEIVIVIFFVFFNRHGSRLQPRALDCAKTIFTRKLRRYLDESNGAHAKRRFCFHGGVIMYGSNIIITYRRTHYTLLLFVNVRVYDTSKFKRIYVCCASHVRRFKYIAGVRSRKKTKKKKKY